MTKNTKLLNIERQKVIRRYTERYKLHGHSPKTLGWDKGKQDLRYHILLDSFNLQGKSILDIGCGFGDALKLIKHRTSNFEFTGIDVVPEFIAEANQANVDDPNIHFICDDFLSHSFTNQFDIIVASGPFNFKLQDQDNLEFIDACMHKAMSLAREGIAFDFLSNQVDFEYDHTFHSDPCIILAMAYQYSRNVVLRNDYMPFEFSLNIMKNDTFSTEDTIFKRFKSERDYYRFY